MKRHVLLLALLGGVAAHAQPLSITQLGHDGLFSWTNWLCTLEKMNLAGGCTFTRYTGTVIKHGFVEDIAVGRLVAERAP